ncbi:MAG: AAA family ATPase [Lachnospiraceae bacterium]|nr:AAA family ATPase [Lachnospiraceae bacterium]
MSEKKKGFSYLRLFVAVGSIALVSVILILIGIYKSDAESLAGVFGEGAFIHSETVYLVLLLALFLPVVLVVLTVIIAKERFGFTLFREKKEQEDTARFRALSGTDAKMKEYAAPAYETTINLAQLCEDFHNYAASKMQLYYSIEDIRKFIAGLGVSHLMVMQGLSGTGKTSLATAIGEYLGNRSSVVSVQPMWKERSDVIGYFNEFTKKFNESTLLKILYEARFTDNMYIVVLDEMNIARVEYYFADFLSLMELDPKNRFLEMTSDTWENDPNLFEDGRFRLPENVWFIGTANNDDSTFSISDKVYDRAMVMNLDRKAQPFIAPQSEGAKIPFSYFQWLVNGAKQSYRMSQDVRDKVAELDRFLSEKYHITYGNRIRMQMEDYVSVFVACGGTQEEALDDFLMKKVLRKLEGLNPVVMAKASTVIAGRLDELFSEDAMPLCRSYLKYLRQLAS